jgi:hypothetical protein
MLSTQGLSYSYLRANGFKTFIVSGGDVDFMHLELNPAPSCAPASPSSLNSVEAGSGVGTEAGRFSHKETRSIKLGFS